MIYRSYSELAGKLLQHGDDVWFNDKYVTVQNTENGEQLYLGLLLDNETFGSDQDNFEILKYFNIEDQNSFVSDIYGYQTIGGQFPAAKYNDFKGITNVTLELFTRCKNYKGDNIDIKQIDSFLQDIENII